MLLLIVRSDHYACDIVLEKFYLYDGETVTVWLVAEKWVVFPGSASLFSSPVRQSQCT
jgi:hypothetical protein